MTLQAGILEFIIFFGATCLVVWLGYLLLSKKEPPDEQ